MGWLMVLKCNNPACTSKVEVSPASWSPLTETTPNGWYYLRRPEWQEPLLFCSAACIGSWAQEEAKTEEVLREQRRETDRERREYKW